MPSVRPSQGPPSGTGTRLGPVNTHGFLSALQKDTHLGGGGASGRAREWDASAGLFGGPTGKFTRPGARGPCWVGKLHAVVCFLWFVVCVSVCLSLSALGGVLRGRSGGGPRARHTLAFAVKDGCPHIATDLTDSVNARVMVPSVSVGARG